MILRYGKDTDLIIHKVENNCSYAVKFDLIDKAELVHIPDTDEESGEQFLRIRI